MSISFSIPSIHGVESLQASVLDFCGSCCLRLTLRSGDADDLEETLGIWFTGPDARERAKSYADALNGAAYQLPAKTEASA
jgi:hypothetical protein